MNSGISTVRQQSREKDDSFGTAAINKHFDQPMIDRPLPSSSKGRRSSLYQYQENKPSGNDTIIIGGSLRKSKRC
jgi:hypothetical protein